MSFSVCMVVFPKMMSSSMLWMYCVVISSGTRKRRKNGESQLVVHTCFTAGHDRSSGW